MGVRVKLPGVADWKDQVKCQAGCPVATDAGRYVQLIAEGSNEPKAESTPPLAIWDVKDAGVTRQGNKVIVKVVEVRSTITPTSFKVKQGDIVTAAVTNIEQETDMLHGFGLLDYNINIVVDPGETKAFTFKADKPGVFPYYCTNFCSALHQEMQGYLIVEK
jgi:nitrous-oxide reductase